MTHASSDFPDIEKPALDYNEESRLQKLQRKSKDSPFMVVGLLGCGAACLYGAYAFKNRGKYSISNYLMQLRVGAQGTVIGCLTVGVAYSLYKRFTGSDKGTGES